MTGTPRRRAVLTALGVAPVAAAVTTGGLAYVEDGADPSGRVLPDLRPGGAFDRHLARLAAEDRYSGVVLLAHRGRPVLRRVHGMAGRGKGVRNTPDSDLREHIDVFTRTPLPVLGR
jgi:hypothetical protein